MEKDYEKVIAKMGKLHIYFRYYLSQAAARNDLHFGQLPILEFIKKHEFCTQKELAQMMSVSAPSIATSVKRLQKAGLLEKMTDEIDMRNNRIKITEKGKELTKKCRIDFDKINKQLISGFSIEEYAQLCEYFDRMIDNLSTEDIPNKNMFCFMDKQNLEK